MFCESHSDRCDRGFHQYCLSPALSSLPAGSWFCAKCTKKRAKEQKARQQQQHTTTPASVGNKKSAAAVSPAGAAESGGSPSPCKDRGPACRVCYKYYSTDDRTSETPNGQMLLW